MVFDRRMSQFNVILPNTKCPYFRIKLRKKYIEKRWKSPEFPFKSPYCLLITNASGLCRNNECPYNKEL